MSEAPGDAPQIEPRRKARGKQPLEIPVDLNRSGSPPSPSVRLDAMTRERIDALENDKRRLIEAADRLQTEVNRLTPEVAHLSEALRNAEANNLVSTVLIVVGGGIISYATFVDGVGRRVADIGAGILLGGVISC